MSNKWLGRKFSLNLPTGGGSGNRGIGFYVHGDLVVEANAMSFIAPIPLTIEEVRLTVDTAPAGADLIVDINKNGTTLYSTQTNRPKIAATALSATAVLPDILSIAVGDKITLDIDQIGSTTAGKSLTLTIKCKE